MDFNEALDCHYHEVYELYREIVSISSQSADKAGVDRVGDKIAEFMTQNDFCVEKCMNPEAGNGVLVSLNQGGPGKRIVLLAHMDTVHKEGTFSEPLFREDVFRSNCRTRILLYARNPPLPMVGDPPICNTIFTA